MATLSIPQDGQIDGQTERERARILRDERKQERAARNLLQAQEQGLDVEEFNDQTHEEISLCRQKISDIDRASDIIYGVLILTALFKSALMVVTLIPIIGIALGMLMSILLMILTTVLLFVAKAAEPVHVHSRFFVRLIVLLLLYILDTVLPLLSFFMPIALASIIGVYILVKRDRHREKKRLEKRLVELGAILEA